MFPSHRPLGRRLLLGALVSLAAFGVVELAARMIAGPPPAAQVYTAVGEKERYLQIAGGTAQRARSIPLASHRSVSCWPRKDLARSCWK